MLHERSYWTKTKVQSFLRAYFTGLNEGEGGLHVRQELLEEGILLNLVNLSHLELEMPSVTAPSLSEPLLQDILRDLIVILT